MLGVRVVGLIGLFVYGVVITMRTFTTLAPDVRDFFAFYQSVEDFWRTGYLYAPHPSLNLNPPHVSVVLFSPLLVTDARTAFAGWTLVTAALVVASVAIIRRELRLSHEGTAWLMAVLLASSAIQHTWRQGQLGGVLLFVCTLTWRALRNDRRSSGGLAVAISLKPWMVCWLPMQTPKAMARTVLYGLAGVALGILVLGVRNWQGWQLVMEASSVRPPAGNLGIYGYIIRARPPGESWVFARELWALASVAVAALTWRARHVDVDRQWLSFGLAGFLISPVSWAYYLLVFAGPLAALCRSSSRSAGLGVAVAMLLLPLELAYMYAPGVLLLWAAVLTHPRPAVEAIARSLPQAEARGAGDPAARR
jgi:hypothetical protein